MRRLQTDGTWSAGLDNVILGNLRYGDIYILYIRVIYNLLYHLVHMLCSVNLYLTDEQSYLTAVTTSVLCLLVLSIHNHWYKVYRSMQQCHALLFILYALILMNIIVKHLISIEHQN